MKAFYAVALAATVSLTAAGGTWTVKTYQDGDVVTASEKDGVTEIDFRITPSVPRLQGCLPFTGGWADILFAEPRALDASDERILYEMSMPAKFRLTALTG